MTGHTDPYPAFLCYASNEPRSTSKVSYRVALYSANLSGQINIDLISSQGLALHATYDLKPRPRSAKAGRMDLIDVLGPDIDKIAKIVVSIPTNTAGKNRTFRSIVSHASLTLSPSHTLFLMGRRLPRARGEAQRLAQALLLYGIQLRD